MFYFCSMNISVACIIYKNSKILIAHRNPVGAMGNRWEFPGGKVDAGENEADSIVREMKEEFGVNSVVGAKITESDFVHNEKKSLLKAYLVELEHDGIEKPFVLTEHTEYKWVCIDEIPSYEFVDSDLKIYPTVKEFLSSLK